MSFLADTNILVYRVDPRDPVKQRKATELLREGAANGQGRLSHQALVEFVAATTRPLKGRPDSSLLTQVEAAREVEEMMRQFDVLYPVGAQLGLALRGWCTYGLSWFDAHLWSYAEYAGLDTLYSEDFQHGRVYGTVRVVNPFA